jgi:hypothetical protein
MKRLHLVFMMIALIICAAADLSACTTAVVSGRFTPDGRPLLFKHRDTGHLQNKLMFFTDGKYSYIGVVNSDGDSGSEVWQGTNSAGFAIMNSASYNLNIGDETELKDREGEVMKLALQSCATVDEFEQLLRDLPKPLGVEANFGCIDAHGGAAYFEVGQRDVTKYDVNDPKVAPFGYIIRTNYSFTRDQDEGYGYIRYQNAENLIYAAAGSGDLTFRFILQQVSRCLKHSLTGTDLWSIKPEKAEPATFVWFEDYIPRPSSASTTVIHGVKPGESPGFTTMWNILGFQLCTPAIPVWIEGGDHLPSILVADAGENAPLCDMAMQLKKKILPITRGSGRRYLNLAFLINVEGSGILQKIRPLEDRILDRTDEVMEQWRESGMRQKEIEKFYDWVNETVSSAYTELLKHSEK